MKLNPQQAPLYGDCVLTVQLADEEVSEDEEEDGVEFYLLFSGSSQRHLTTTRRVSHATLQAICPAHNMCEAVRVTLCSARPQGPVDPLSEESFCYVQDLALDLARFLLTAAGAPHSPEGALLLEERQVGLKECERLDHSLTLALGHLPLPPGWSVLGPQQHPAREEGAADLENGTDLTACDTLLHFAARRGLQRLAVFLLQQPGGREALHVPDQQGSLPGCLARAKGHHHLLKLFQQ
ncbi:A-kinase anchor protein 13-like [Aplochiton taeniatus]